MENVLVFNIEDLEKKALDGDGLSCYILGRSYFSEENGVTCDYNKSLFWYKYGYEKLNDPRCQYGMAICYEDGVGGLYKDKNKSNKLFSEAYESILNLKEKDPFSMFILGAYYFYGLAGISIDYEKAFKTILDSANFGHIGGIYDIGVFYHDGIGTEKDYKKSKMYLEIASKNGLKRSEQRLIEWSKDFASINSN